MSRYLVRRLIQMVVVVLTSAAASYALLNLAPGGPLTGLRQLQQNQRFRLTPEDVARIRAYFELDLSPPVRFARWLIGQPAAPSISALSSSAAGCRSKTMCSWRTANLKPGRSAAPRSFT